MPRKLVYMDVTLAYNPKVMKGRGRFLFPMFCGSQGGRLYVNQIVKQAQTYVCHDATQLKTADTFQQMQTKIYGGRDVQKVKPYCEVNNLIISSAYSSFLAQENFGELFYFLRAQKESIEAPFLCSVLIIYGYFY